jgi:hypothetical protein
VSLAIATHTSPADWWGEDDATIATAWTILADQAEAARAAMRR